MKQVKGIVKEIRKYKCLRIKEDSIFQKNNLEEKFEYKGKSKIFDERGQFECRFNNQKIEMIINDIMNNGGWNLISVSEDDKSISYHFVKVEKIQI